MNLNKTSLFCSSLLNLLSLVFLLFLLFLLSLQPAPLNPPPAPMCAPLSDYSQFAHDVTKYKYEGNQSEAAVNRAIDGLPEGIVKDIISAHRAEATDMFLTEYDEELTHRGFYEVGVEDGMAKGEAKGKAEGKAEANLETARNMLADGMPEDKVAKYTSLPIEEVRKLKKN